MENHNQNVMVSNESLDVQRMNAIKFLTEVKWVPSLIGYTPAEQGTNYLIRLKDVLESMGYSYEVIETHTPLDKKMGMTPKQDALTIRISRATMDQISEDAKEMHMDKPEVVM